MALRTSISPFDVDMALRLARVQNRSKDQSVGVRDLVCELGRDVRLDLHYCVLY